DSGAVVAKVQVGRDGAVAMSYPDVVPTRGARLVVRAAWSSTGAGYDSVARGEHLSSYGHSEIYCEAMVAYMDTLVVSHEHIDAAATLEWQRIDSGRIVLHCLRVHTRRSDDSRNRDQKSAHPALVSLLLQAGSVLARQVISD